jgi:hypothetical protein
MTMCKPSQRILKFLTRSWINCDLICPHENEKRLAMWPAFFAPYSAAC